MENLTRLKKLSLTIILGTGFKASLYAQTVANTKSNIGTWLILCLLTAIVLLTLIVAYRLSIKTNEVRKTARKAENDTENNRFKKYLNTLDSKQIETFLKIKNNKPKNVFSYKSIKSICILFLITFLSTINNNLVFAQPTTTPASLLSEWGIIITIVLIFIPVFAGIIFMLVKITSFFKKYQKLQDTHEAKQFAEYLNNPLDAEVETTLLKRKKALDYTLTHNELAGNLTADDDKGLLQQVNTHASLPFVSLKKKALGRYAVEPDLAKLILWFIGTATFWLVLGTSVGEYLGIKFVAPDVDHVSWLSFGRLRPVHTNMVFWGWASLGMLGLGHYVVPKVGNTPLASLKMGWYTLYFVNASVIFGTISLMAGINNGGGEYREYIWPIALLLAIGLVLTLINFIKTIANRTTKEIYISNWYIVAATIFAIVITLVAYLPFWQNGLGETIVQGYYMHQGVGMWFMMFTLGIVYYFLPQQLNKPIYSYSLGILAFWAQIIFYTLIGTHHFVFSAIPWWLQTIAIVGSTGMLIPVAAGSTNFILTFKGAWYKVPSSYTLPFFLVGIIFYFTGSLQGTAEAFKSTNLIWHFTDFTVAHSHIAMYGIICFFIWAGIYAVVPRLTGKEAPQVTVGAHFWLALIGLLFYSVPLMYGSTLKGLMWVEGEKPFIESVVFMAPYWLWRAIGGSLMWLSHLFFAYNFYKMLSGSNVNNVNEMAIQNLNKFYASADTTL
ncbi:MAG: cytochrome oxidase subunit I [Sphingobacteriales bacterium]|nr:MAG: cytochrome oxidase subunit I [Sphingobacteriales bacterium]